jgi:hypothetical protein
MTTSCQEKVSLRNTTGFSHSIPRSREFESYLPKPMKNPALSWDFRWCKIVDAFQTSAINSVNDYKLKHLAEAFGLLGELLETNTVRIKV